MAKKNCYRVEGLHDYKVGMRGFDTHISIQRFCSARPGKILGIIFAL